MIHTSTITVRHYECDAYGHVNNANYLRYMEVAAIEASAAVGYDEARYNAMGTFWLIYETDIDYLLPLRAGDVVEIKTWVADFRRVRSQRYYEFRRQGEDALAARAVTDWVYLDRETQRPLTVPPEMIAAFSPDGAPDSAPRKDVPDAPPPPPRTFSMQRRVEWRDIDMNRHVNNATYLNYMEECAIESLGSFGWSLERLEAEDIAIVARRYQIAYKTPAVWGDELRVTTYLSDLRRIAAVRHFQIVRAHDGEVVARANAQWAFIHPSSGQIARVPEAILTDFADHVAT
ncbi:MAG: YbgC/FadM family acyl-CoA thioesterase [Anaerolineae bacterium]|nr:YbgC/FadM family acyl-CoA thioesterase [Anaerolineae bacterium]